MKKKILVLSVDRDNDLGEKVGIKGPLFGRSEVLDSAITLALKDPTESDANVLLGAVSIRDRLEEEGEDVEVGAITGHKDVGYKSEREIASQFNKILKKFKAQQVILVTDGREDEIVMPILQKKVETVSPERIIVQQHESLEEQYHILHRYFRRLVEDRKVSGLLVGVPGTIIFILGLFWYLKIPQYAWPSIAVIVGTYLMLRGFGLAQTVFEEFSPKRISFFTYIVAILLLVFGVWNGVSGLEKTQSLSIKIPKFLVNSNPWFSIAILTAIFGKIADTYSRKSSALWNYVRLLFFVGGLLYILHQFAQYMLANITIDTFYLSSVASIVFTLLIWSITYREEKKSEVVS